MTASAALQIVVTGASGRQGIQLIRQLMQYNGYVLSIRAVVTDKNSERAQNVLAQAKKVSAATANSVKLYETSYADADGLKQVCEGVDAVFILTRPTFGDHEKEIWAAQAIIDAAESSKTTRHLVYTSVVGADDPIIWARIGGLSPWATHATIKPTAPVKMIPPADYAALGEPSFGTEVMNNARVGLRGYFSAKLEIECRVRAWANRAPDQRTWSVLRPAFFMSNPLEETEVFFPELGTPQRVLRTAMKMEKRLMLVAPEDIGQVGALALVEPALDPGHKLARAIVNIGSQTLRVDEMAAIMTNVSGHQVHYDFVDETIAQKEAAAGNPQRDIQGWVLERENCFNVGDLEAALGIRTMSFQTYLTKHQDQLEAVLCSR